jgi:uncharacterized membrane protein YccC
MLVARLLDTGIGIAVGLLVNLLVWPPLRDRAAAHQVGLIDDRIGTLLSDMATTLRRRCTDEDIDGWIARTGELDHDIEQAWSVVRQARESGRFNPRRVAGDRMRRAANFDPILERVEHAVAETRSTASTIRLASLRPGDWHPSFRTPWLELLERAGDAVSRAHREAVEATRADLDAIADDLAVHALPEGFWPVCGALLVNLRNILEALGPVADAQPVEVPAPALTMLRRGKPAQALAASGE